MAAFRVAEGGLDDSPTGAVVQSPLGVGVFPTTPDHLCRQPGSEPRSVDKNGPGWSEIPRGIWAVRLLAVPVIQPLERPPPPCWDCSVNWNLSVLWSPIFADAGRGFKSDCASPLPCGALLTPRTPVWCLGPQERRWLPACKPPRQALPRQKASGKTAWMVLQHSSTNKGRIRGGGWAFGAGLAEVFCDQLPNGPARD